MAENKKSTFGLDKNIAAAATYLLAWVSGLVFFLAEKDDSDIRFHASQSIIFFGALTLLSIVPVIGWALSPFLFLIGLIGWIVLLVKAYQGERFKLPLVGDYAEKLAKRKV
ncbi:hypothetical protein C4578_04235 [Candidatus Microgenomates bacterium]|jgi:uncharacterized membrane protein|nr:MAG: hypothetical protein C4578_04235 [Candidatus Microgenomates bacterium]